MRKVLVIVAVLSGLTILFIEFDKLIQTQYRPVSKTFDPLRQRASVAPLNMPRAREQTFKSGEQWVVSGNSPLEVAENYIELNKESLGIKEYHEPRPIVFESPVGSQVKFSFYQDGVPIVGLYLRLSLDNELNIIENSNHYLPLEQVEIPASDSLEVADVVDRLSDRYEHLVEDTSEVDMVLFLPPSSQKPTPAYVVKVLDRKSSVPVSLVLRAKDGQILSRISPRQEF